MGILKNEEQEGLARIKEIDMSMNLAIAEAVAAKNSDQLDLAQQKLSAYKQLQQEKLQGIQTIYKNYMDRREYLDDLMLKQSSEDRNIKNQSLKELQVAAPELLAQYNKLVNQTDKDTWIKMLAKQTGLDENVIMGIVRDEMPTVKKTTTTSTGGGASTTKGGASATSSNKFSSQFY
jgi:hypothetical protein